MPHFNLSVKQGRKGFQEEILYDANVAVLIHYAGYRHRATAFKRFGLLNHSGLKAHVTVIGSIGDGQFADEICAGWPDGISVTFLEMSSDRPTPRINGYYLWLKDSGLAARWHLRVDDDSITDLALTVKRLDERCGKSAVHLTTHVVEEEPYNFPFTRFVQQNGINMPRIVHEWESSVTSQKAIKQIFNAPAALDFIEKTGREISEPGDRSLSFAAVIAGISIGDNKIFTPYFQPWALSLFAGGEWTHIHYVPWGDIRFLAHLEAYVFRKSFQWEEIEIMRLMDRPARFGRCLNQAHAILRLRADGSIEGSESFCEMKWKREDQGDELHVLHVEGYSTTVFKEWTRNDKGTWFFGPCLREEQTRFLYFEAE